jgi:hypothetical protein
MVSSIVLRMQYLPGCYEIRNHAVPVLAGQRVRMASLIVGPVDGAPIRVVRSTFATLTFDEDDHTDSGMFTRRQWALAESTLDPALVNTKHEEKVLDAATRFIARGGRWHPAASLAGTISEAALGKSSSSAVANPSCSRARRRRSH